MEENEQLFITSVIYSEVPEYLKEGEFFKSLNDEDDQQAISVPLRTLKPDISVNSNADLVHLLHSLQFWIVEHIPDTVFEDILLNRKDCCLAVADYLTTFPSLKVALNLRSKLPSQQMMLAVEQGDMRVVLFLQKKGVALPPTLAAVAARNGRLGILQYIVSLYTTVSVDACEAAVWNGHLDCFRYLHEGSLYPRSVNLCTIAV